MKHGFFGSLFDLNHDGELDREEQFLDYMAFQECTKESESSYSYDEDEEELEDSLDMAGLDYDELEYMDEDERRGVLEDAGLDPDDYEF